LVVLLLVNLMNRPNPTPIKEKLKEALPFLRSKAFVSGTACLLAAMLVTLAAVSFRQLSRVPGGEDQYVWPNQPGFLNLPDRLSPSRPSASEKEAVPPAQEAEGSANCTYPVEYWQAYPEAWDIEHITVGRTSFTKEEVLRFFEMEGQQPALALFKQYFAAALNTINGAQPGAHSGLLAEAGEWVAAHRPVSPLLGAEPQEIQALTSRLLAFNTGRLGPGICPDLPGALAAQISPTSTPVVPPDELVMSEEISLGLPVVPGDTGSEAEPRIIYKPMERPETSAPPPPGNAAPDPGDDDDGEGYINPGGGSDQPPAGDDNGGGDDEDDDEEDGGDDENDDSGDNDGGDGDDDERDRNHRRGRGGGRRGRP
jgi:hypothetical protein